jgi:conjugal transfer ATP-binding protein TraC
VDPRRAVFKEQAATLREMARRRAAYYRKGAAQALHRHSNLRMRTFRAWMSVVVPAKDPFSETAQRAVIALRQTHITTLQSFHLYAGTWDVRDLIATCALLLNPQRLMFDGAQVFEYDPDRELRYQIVNADTRIKVDECCVGFSSRPDRSDELCAVGMSTRAYPQAFSLHMMGRLLGAEAGTSLSYPCPFLITTGVSIPDYETEKGRVLLKAANAERTAGLEIARYIPNTKEINQDWKIAQAAFDAGKGTVRMYVQLLMYCRPSEREQVEEIAKGIWRECRFEIANDRKMQLQALLASLPMLYGPLLARDMKIAHRDSTKTMFNAANMLPVVSEWKGTPPRDAGDPRLRRWVPVLTLVGRRGQLMSVDPFANANGNYNAIVVGTSGSGKSVLLNELATRTLATGGRVFIIDSGYSYKKLCEQLGGQFIDVQPDANICLNPFSMIDDIDEGMALLIPLIEQMASFRGTLGEYELSQLQTHVADVWATARLMGRTPTITMLAESLRNNCFLGGPNPRAGDEEYRQRMAAMDEEERAKHCDPRIRDLGVQLGPFTADGQYGRFFEGEANIDFDSNLVVLELNSLSAKKHLQSVVMLLMLYKITSTLYNPALKSLPKLVIIDEAWQLLSGGDASGTGGAGQFIEFAYRTARKWNAAIVTATQSCGDYQKSGSAMAAFENSDCMYLLRQKGESIDALRSAGKLAIDEHQTRMLKSLTTVQGMFSEVFVRIGDLPPAVGRLFLDPFSLLLYSSKASEFEEVRRYTQAGLSTADAIRQVLRDRGMPEEESFAGQEGVEEESFHA